MVVNCNFVMLVLVNFVKKKIMITSNILKYKPVDLFCGSNFEKKLYFFITVKYGL